jgi:hypothetical protein
LSFSRQVLPKAEHSSFFYNSKQRANTAGLSEERVGKGKVWKKEESKSEI